MNGLWGGGIRSPQEEGPGPGEGVVPPPQKTFLVFDHKMVQLDAFLKIKVLYCF